MAEQPSSRTRAASQRSKRSRAKREARAKRLRIQRPSMRLALVLVVLVGLLFAFVYLAVADLRDAPFFAQEGAHQQSEYVYFSFVTLTTLGFGDLSPALGLPQALVALEALLGQIFLVTLVARLVTLWVRQGDAS